MKFELCKNCNGFFEILPLDWKETILPFWDELKASTKGHILVENSKIIAGGLVFSKCPPDMLYAKEEANEWFNKGYLYVGFIYVIEERRHQNLGSIWLDNLKKTDVKQKYWLTIENLKLHAFYVKNGFKKIKKLPNGKEQEWLYAFNV